MPVPGSTTVLPDPSLLTLGNLQDFALQSDDLGVPLELPQHPSHHRGNKIKKMSVLNQVVARAATHVIHGHLGVRKSADDKKRQRRTLAR